jgi:uncharacterized protein YkwD
MSAGNRCLGFIKKMLCTAGLVTAGLLYAPQAADASGDPASQIVTLMNAERSAAGLTPVTAHWDLEDDAQRHAEKMAREGRTSTIPNIEAVTGGWSSLSEFEGTGMSAEQIHRTAMAQANHNRAVHGDYDHVGVGVARSESGRLWVAVVLMQVAPCAQNQDQG